MKYKQNDTQIPYVEVEVLNSTSCCMRPLKKNLYGAQKALDHQASFLASREKILWLEIKPPTSPLSFGYLSTII